MENLSEYIIALERSALDRWITFDPQGYLDLFAPEVTYFDPHQERRVDGREAMITNWRTGRRPCWLVGIPLRSTAGLKETGSSFTVTGPT